MSETPTVENWRIERTWTLTCSRCKDEGTLYDETESPELALHWFQDMGWTCERELEIRPDVRGGIWCVYCKMCNKTRRAPEGTLTL